MPKTNRISIIIISLLASIALTVTGLYYYNNRIQNIFDEIIMIPVAQEKSVMTYLGRVMKREAKSLDSLMMLRLTIQMFLIKK